MSLTLGAIIKKIKMISQETQMDICTALFRGFYPRYSEVDKNRASAYAGCRESAPRRNIVGFMGGYSLGNGLDKVAARYHNGLSKYIRIPDRPGFVAYVLQLIEQHTTPAEDLFYQDGFMDWNEFITLRKFNFDDFLASICRVVIMGDNKDDGGIEDNAFHQGVRNKTAEIDLEKEPEELLKGMDAPVSDGIEYTLGDIDLTKYFREVTVGQNPIHMGSKRSDLRFFFLPPDNGRFNTSLLMDLLYEMVLSYVYTNKKISSGGRGLEARALHDLMDEASENGDDLRDLLSYFFSEKCIPAPKIMTALQMKLGGAYSPRSGRSSKVFHSRGIHLAVYDSANGNGRYVQFIFTVSTIQDDLDAGIDEVINTMLEIHSEGGSTVNLSREEMFLNNSSTSINIDSDLADLIKLTVLPEKASGPRDKDIGFSAFVGFKMPKPPDATKDMDVTELSTYIKDTLQGCLHRKMAYIRKKLQDAGITQSVYFYFLPFEDPARDKKEVMDAFLMR